MIDVSLFPSHSADSPLIHFLLVPPGDTKYYRSAFLRDFWHLNVAMMTSNNALIPDPDKEDILASKPFDWPFLQLGLRMCGWGNLQLKYYLLGNPIVWWGSSISMFASVLVFGLYVLRMQRKYIDMEPSEFVRLDRRVPPNCIFLDRRMGSFLICWQNCVLWLGAPLWYELC